MNTHPRARAEIRWLGTTSAIVISLVLIFVALLGIGNEIRYQGCVARLDAQNLIAVTRDARNPEPVLLDCSRSPF